jgi:hypothetical protein
MSAVAPVGTTAEIRHNPVRVWWTVALTPPMVADVGLAEPSTLDAKSAATTSLPDCGGPMLRLEKVYELVVMAEVT